MIGFNPSAIATTTTTIQFSAATYTVNENAGSISLPVTLSAASSSTVTVNYATEDGTAHASSAYSARGGTLAWSAGSTTSGVITVPILNEQLTSGTQTFKVILSSPSSNASLGSISTATVTINDQESVAVQFSAATYTVNENAGSVNLPVTLSGASGSTVSVNYATEDGTAHAGSAYSARGGTLSWAAGSTTSGVITVPILNEQLTSGTQTFKVILSSPSTGASLGSVSTATVTINDNDVSTATTFTPLHLYYLSPTGNDKNNGTSPTTAWATPNHPVVCGDVIIAAAGNYTNQFNQDWGTVSPTSCPSVSGGIDGKGGIYFATVLCAGPDLEACQVNSGKDNAGFDIEQESNWAVEGFKVTTDGLADGNSLTPAFDGACGGPLKGSCTATYHHFAFINNIAYNSSVGFSPSGAPAAHSVDYFAVIGNIAQNSAQGNPNAWLCVAAIDVVGPTNSDTLPGTHLYVYGNFSYDNIATCPTDVENYMFDTWDENSYSSRGVAQNNMGWLSGRFNFQVTDHDLTPTTAPAFILNNTLYGSSQSNIAGAQSDQWLGAGIDISAPKGATTIWGSLTVQDNLVQENLALIAGDTESDNGPIYAFDLGGPYTNVIVGGTGNQNWLNALATTCVEAACAPSTAPYSAISSGTLAQLGTNYYTSPAFRNTADLIANRSGTPNCSGFTNTTACMGYNANTKTLTNPSAIYDLQPTASGAASAGYQLPSTQCVTSGSIDTYYPTWLKGIVYLQWDASTATITENADLVTKPCGL